MQRITHREYLTWQKWEAQQWNEPSRSDHYLMRVAQRVQQVLAKEPNKITLDHQRVPFRQVKQQAPATKPTKQTLTEWTKARWAGMVGLVRKRKKNDASQRRGYRTLR